MKIVQVNAVCGIRSTGRNVTELTDGFIKRGHEVRTYYGEAYNQLGGWKGDATYLGTTFDHKLHALLSRITGLNGYFSCKYTRRFLKTLQHEQPDIVYLHNLHGNFINLPMLLKWLGKNNVATVVSLHDCQFFTGGCVHYSLNNCYKWKQECGNCQFRKEGMKSWFFDRSKKILNDKKKLLQNIARLGVIGVSDWIIDQGRQSPLFANAKTKRIYNWIDLDVFKAIDSENTRKEMGLEGKKVVLGVASSWSDSKGLNRFVDLSCSLDESYQVILVGDMKEKPVNGRIINIPQTDSVETLVKYYSLADVFLQLSPQETFGKVVAEAFACGTPVIAVNRTANVELIDPLCGMLVEMGDLEGCENAVKEICACGKEKYSDYCRKKASELFGFDFACDEHLSFFNEVLKMKMMGDK